MPLKVDIIKDYGTLIEYSVTNRVVAQVVRYNDGEPLLSVQRQWRKDAGEEWQPGKRPAMDEQLCKKVLTLLPKAIKVIESANKKSK